MTADGVVVCDERWNTLPNQQAAPERPDMVFLSRDGGIRTHDLSVPKGVGAVFGVSLRTNYQVRGYEQTGMDPSNCERMFDKCSMRPAKSDAIAGHPFCTVLPYDALNGCFPTHIPSERR